MTKVINFFAGPGAGKSTLSAGLFHEMKLKGINVELVTEFAKDLTWEGHMDDLRNPMYVTGTQLRRMQRLVGQVDYIITDSPILVACLYIHPKLRTPFEEILVHYHNQFNNINFLVERVKNYQPKGRNQTYEDALKLDQEVRSLPVPVSEGITPIVGDGAGVHMALAELKL